MAANYNHPRKGSSIRAEPIKDTKAILDIRRLLKDSPRDQLLFVMGINNGLRIGDLLGLKTKDVCDLKPGDHIEVTESMTGKKNVLVMNNTVCQVLQEYLAYMKIKQKSSRQRSPQSEYLFRSRKGGLPLTNMRVNGMVKQWTAAVGLSGNYGAHSLRKTWGYHQLKDFGVDIGLVSKRFNHMMPAQTRNYLGIKYEDSSLDELTYNELG